MIFIPVRDTIPSERLPLINYVLIALNIFAFVYTWSLSPETRAHFGQTYGLIPGNYPSLQALLFNPQALFTSMFLHASLTHLGGNLLYLFIFGDNIEDRLGHFRYLLFYVTCGLFAGVSHLLENPQSTVPMVGASGALAGVLGAYFLLYPRAKIVNFFWFFIVKFIKIPAVLYLGFWFFMQVQGGLHSADSATAGGVAFWAHIGGFIAGLLLVYPMGAWRKRKKSTQRRR